METPLYLYLLKLTCKYLLLNLCFVSLRFKFSLLIRSFSGSTRKTGLLYPVLILYSIKDIYKDILQMSLDRICYLNSDDDKLAKQCRLARQEQIYQIMVQLKETGDIYGIKINITEVSLYKMSQWKAKTKKEIEK